MAPRSDEIISALLRRRARIFALLGLIALRSAVRAQSASSSLLVDRDGIWEVATRRGHGPLTPGRDVFLVWNRNLRHPLSDGAFAASPVSDEVVLKLRWTFRR